MKTHSAKGQGQYPRRNPLADAIQIDEILLTDLRERQVRLRRELAELDAFGKVIAEIIAEGAA